jgi:hypothetical protein
MICVAMLLLLLGGCAAPTCYPPNKIIGSSCCLDADDNGVCDLDEEVSEEEDIAEEEVEEVEEEVEVAEEEPEEVEMEEEPQIQDVEMPEPEPIVTGLQLGKQDMKLGEQRDYLQINKLSAYRTSRDKGIMNYMVFTVRNVGQTKLNPIVDLMFEGARVEEHEARVIKEYVIQPLEPGEKMVINQSLGIRFSEIEETKKITLRVYEKYIAPREDLEVLNKEFIPTDYMDSMEIYTYGLPDY